MWKIIETIGLAIGGLLFIIEGFLKFAGVNEILSMITPCGLSLILVGVGAIAHVVRHTKCEQMHKA
ncbi:MAG: hypothetical protein ACXQTS_04405 [Candidatus Methanospirareceae archaeon]